MGLKRVARLACSLAWQVEGIGLPKELAPKVAVVWPSKVQQIGCVSQQGAPLFAKSGAAPSFTMDLLPFPSFVIQPEAQDFRPPTWWFGLVA